MKDYKLTIEDGVITWVENTDENGNPISRRLFIPKEVTAFAINACNVKIVVPSSVRAIGAFGTELEAKDSDIEVYNSMPSILYPKKDNLAVTCHKYSNVSNYCKKYGINVSDKTTN